MNIYEFLKSRYTSSNVVQERWSLMTWSCDWLCTCQQVLSFARVSLTPACTVQLLMCLTMNLSCPHCASKLKPNIDRQGLCTTKPQICPLPSGVDTSLFSLNPLKKLTQPLLTTPFGTPSNSPSGCPVSLHLQTWGLAIQTGSMMKFTTFPVRSEKPGCVWRMHQSSQDIACLKTEYRTISRNSLKLHL